MTAPLKILQGSGRQVLSPKRIHYFATVVEEPASAFDELLLFPALFRKDHRQTLPPPTINDPEVRCFYNDALPAQYVCQQSGRYISAAYAIEWHDQVVCAEYLQSLQAQEKVEVKNEFVRYDVIAFNLAFGGIFLSIFGLVIFTAPAALILSVTKWKSLTDHPLSPRRWRLIVALILSLLQVGGIVLFIVLIVYGMVGELE